VSSALYVRLSTGLNQCEDLANLKEYEKYGFARQVIPKNLQRRTGESLPQWRDRVYHEYRLPTIIAALTDLKLAYVEQISPLLAKNILRTVRELPDHLRTNKKLFREIVDDFNLNIKYATKGAIAKPEDILKSKGTIKLIKHTLSNELAKSIFPLDFLALVLSNLNAVASKNKRKEGIRGKKVLRKLTPGFLKNIYRKSLFQPKVDFTVIGFRIYIVCQMYELLRKNVNLKNQNIMTGNTTSK
jgi:hypothetical protein